MKVKIFVGYYEEVEEKINKFLESNITVQDIKITSTSISVANGNRLYQTVMIQYENGFFKNKKEETK